MAEKRSNGKTVTVTQVRSSNRRNRKHLMTLKALGLGRIGRSKDHVLTPSTEGMLYSVQQLVEIFEHKKGA